MDWSQISLFAQVGGLMLLFVLFFGAIAFAFWIWSIHKQYGDPKLIVCTFREHNRHLTTEFHRVSDQGTFVSKDADGKPLTYLVDTEKVWFDSLPSGAPSMFRVTVSTYDYFRGKTVPLDPIIHDEDTGAAATQFIADENLFKAAFQFFGRAFAGTLQKAEVILIVLIVVAIAASAGSAYMAMQSANASKAAAAQTAALMDLIQGGPSGTTPLPSATPTRPMRPASLTGAP